MTDSAKASLPIREISRLTGVNSVTLRAWERRYGLLKPLRTNKGHRLYTADDLELVKNIQGWLKRGLAIGRISEMLATNSPEEDSVENVWQDHLAELQQIIAEVRAGRLENFFGELLAVYPPAIIADRLIYPVLNQLNQPNFGNNIKKIIFVNHLSEYLMMLIQRQRHHQGGSRVGIIQLDDPAEPLLNLFLHYGFTMAHYKSNLIGLVAAEEILFAIEKLQLNCLVVYNNSVTSLTQWEKNLNWLVQKIHIPMLVGGNLVQAMKPSSSPRLQVAQGAHQQDMLDLLEKIMDRTATEKNIHE